MVADASIRGTRDMVDLLIVNRIERWLVSDESDAGYRRFATFWRGY